MDRPATKFAKPASISLEDVDYCGWELMGFADLAGFEAWLADSPSAPMIASYVQGAGFSLEGQRPPGFVEEVENVGDRGGWKGILPQY